MGNWLVERRLSQVAIRLKSLRTELSVIDEQMIHLGDDADDQAIRAPGLRDRRRIVRGALTSATSRRCLGQSTARRSSRRSPRWRCARTNSSTACDGRVQLTCSRRWTQSSHARPGARSNPCTAPSTSCPRPARSTPRIGIDDRMRGYFASRAAPMGAVPASVVIATFFNFDPDLVRASMDGVWDQVTPEVVLGGALTRCRSACCDGSRPTASTGPTSSRRPSWP